MSYYGTQDFERMIAAKGRIGYVPSYEIELTARRLRAEAFAELVRRASKAVAEFFAKRPAPAAAAPHVSELDKARLAQGEAIAERVIVAQAKVRDFFADRPAAAAAATLRLSEQDRARMAQAEAIADTVLAVARFVKRIAAPAVERYQAWRTTARTRDELNALDDRTLADIGLTRNDIPRVAAGMWVPENRAARTIYTVPAPATNLNKPQIAA